MKRVPGRGKRASQGLLRGVIRPVDLRGTPLDAVVTR